MRGSHDDGPASGSDQGGGRVVAPDRAVLMSEGIGGLLSRIGTVPAWRGPAVERRPGRVGGQPRSFTSGDHLHPRLAMPRPTTAKERRFAAGVGIALIVLAALVTPFAAVPLRPIPGFVVAYATAHFILDLLVGVLLLCKARIENDHNHLNLGTAYLFCGMVVLLHLLSFPEALVPGMVIGVAGSATWLWLFWHAGFPLMIIGCCLRAGRRHVAPPRALGAVLTALLLAGMFGYVGVFEVARLPVILQGGHYFFGPVGTGIKLGLLAISLTAAILVPLTYRVQTTQGLWLAVSTVAICTDVWLTTRSGHRFSVGWYCGRFGGLSGVFIIFISLLTDVLLTYSSVAAANDVLDKLTLTDALTELGNRRLFDSTLTAEWKRCRRDNVALAVVMVDVDSFKAFNDKFGHQAGDACLQQIGAQLKVSAARPADLAVRYGGEEFALILPSTDSQGADHLARLIRLRVRDLRIANPGTSQGFVTVSAGVASLTPSEAFEANELVSLADNALYRAKASGRDTVVVAGEETGYFTRHPPGPPLT